MKATMSIFIFTLMERITTGPGEIPLNDKDTYTLS